MPPAPRPPTVDCNPSIPSCPWRGHHTTSPGPYPLEAYTGYSALNTAGGTDTNNSLVTASTTLADNLTTCSLKFASAAASQFPDSGGKTPTLSNGGLLPTGTGIKNLALRGTGAGLSTFAGDITNGTIATLNIVMNGSGTHKLITSGAPVNGSLDAADTTGTLGDFAIELKLNGSDLELVVTGGPANNYTDWAASFLPTVIGQPADDHYSDGLTNDDERILGLNPTSGSWVNPITVPFDSSTGTFSFTRRDPSLTGLTDKVWHSTDLAGWQVDPDAVLTPGAIVNHVQTVAVEPGADMLDEPKLFLSVGAEEPAPSPPLLSEIFEHDNRGFTVAPWWHRLGMGPSQLIQPRRRHGDQRGRQPGQVLGHQPHRRMPACWDR